MSMKGHCHSEETKERISKSRKGKCKGNKNPAKRLEIRKKISLSKIGISRSIVTRRKISKGHQGIKMPSGTGEKISRSNTGRVVSKETRKKISKSNKGRSWTLSKEQRKRKHIMQLKKWQDPVYKEKRLRAIFAGHNTSPNKPERRLENGLTKMFPGEYKFVGNGKTFVGGKCPDFINVNGQKKIIEMFGDYWHFEGHTGRTRKQEENQRVRHFKKYGFRTLIIWEMEFGDISQLKKKLKEFHNE